jgi:hypothetical protein
MSAILAISSILAQLRHQLPFPENLTGSRGNEVGLLASGEPARNGFNCSIEWMGRAELTF